MDVDLQLLWWHRLLALRLQRDAAGLHHCDWYARHCAVLNRRRVGSVYVRTEQFGLSLISNLNRVHRGDETQIAVRTEQSTGVSQVVPIHRSASVVNQAFRMDSVENVLEEKLSWRGLSAHY